MPSAATLPLPIGSRIATGSRYGFDFRTIPSPHTDAHSAEYSTAPVAAQTPQALAPDAAAHPGQKQKEQHEPTDRERLRRKPHCRYCMSRIANWIHSCAPLISCQTGKTIRSLVQLRVRFLRGERNLMPFVKAPKHSGIL